MVARPPRFSRRPRSFLNGRRSFDFEHRRTTLERIAKGGKRRAKTSRNWICALEGDIRSGLSLCWNRKVYRRTRQFCWRHEPTLFWKATGSDGNAVRVHPAFWRSHRRRTYRIWFVHEGWTDYLRIVTNRADFRHRDARRFPDSCAQRPVRTSELRFVMARRSRQGLDRSHANP